MRRINLFAISILLLTLIGCNKEEVKWEYKVLSVSNEGYSRDSRNRSDDAAKATTVTPSEVDLNTYGAEQWELVSSYLESETAYPDFGAVKNQLAGLQPNVRPQRVVLIFKRQLNIKKTK